jgi:hypothetical protein
MAEKDLLRVIHRIVTDGEFRSRFACAPHETLITELGLSSENYQALVALAPVLLAGGLFILTNGGIIDPSNVPQMGGWGRGG